MKKILLISFLLVFTYPSFSQYPRDQKIIAAEYFINADPGEGNGTVINTGGTPLWEVTINVPNISLPIGSKLYIRFKSTNGKWSAPRSIVRKPYFENRGGNIQYGECFINIDPGQGGGQQLIFQNGITNINNLNIKRGDRIYVRIKDNMNRWSPSRPITFNFKEIDKAEYYIKYGSGGSSNPQMMNITPYNQYSCVYTANANDIPKNNFDTAYVRFQTPDKFYSQWEKKRMDNVGINEKHKDFYQLSNYPNPFSDKTTISFSLPERAFISVKIIGGIGNPFQSMVTEEIPAGEYKIEFNGTTLPQGIYFCQLNVNNHVESIKLLLQK
jgi:hypothetical protein